MFFDEMWYVSILTLKQSKREDYALIYQAIVLAFF